MYDNVAHSKAYHLQVDSISIHTTKAVGKRNHEKKLNETAAHLWPYHNQVEKSNFNVQKGTLNCTGTENIQENDTYI